MSNTRVARAPKQGPLRISQTQELHRRLIGLAMAGDHDGMVNAVEEFTNAQVVLGSVAVLLAQDVATARSDLSLAMLGVSGAGLGRAPSAFPGGT